MYLKQFCTLVTRKVNLTRLTKATTDCGKRQLYLMASSVTCMLNISLTEHLAADEIIVLFKQSVIFQQYIAKKHKCIWNQNLQAA